MKHFGLFFITAVIFFATQGCGTIMQGTKQHIGFNSTPSDARVFIDGREQGVTPMVAEVRRKEPALISIRLAGYEPYELFLTRSTSGWMWGNVVFGGIIGIAIDAAAGGMYKLSPERIDADFSSGASVLDNGEDGLFITVVLEPDPSWEKIGELSQVK
ncbi:MAG: hypothetical protein JJU13_12125 [Balneolaceae bacterium]|nr:hypothetical protein [Balneolaceae bacterium]